MNKKERIRISKNAAFQYGLKAQLDKLDEEYAEAKLAIIHFFQGKDELNHVQEELGDLENALMTVKEVFDPVKINLWRDKKLRRLQNRIETAIDLQDGPKKIPTFYSKLSLEEIRMGSDTILNWKETLSCYNCGNQSFNRVINSPWRFVCSECKIVHLPYE